MAWPTNKYQASKLVGMIGEEWVHDYLKRNWMDTEIKDVRQDPAWKLMDVDFAVTQFKEEAKHGFANVVLIEVKTDQHTLKTNNFAFEVEKKFAIGGNNVQGAWPRSKADQWWYVCATEHMEVLLYVLNAKVMRDIYTNEVMARCFDVTMHEKDNGDKFWCRLVPVDHVPLGWRGMPRRILSADQLDERMAAIMEREGVK